MKRISAVLAISVLFILCISLTACGSGESKLTGISAQVAFENDEFYSENLNLILNDKTPIENDYALRADRKYNLLVTYTWRGSKAPILNADDVKLNYDNDCFEIKALKNNDSYARFELSIKRAVINSVIIIEVGDFFDTVIIRAE